MSVELLIANFLRIATEDRNAIYLCEQAAEKVIRAVVTSEGTHAGIKHELAEMVDLIPDGNPLKPDLRAIEHLSQYATAYRYPVSSSKTKRIPRAPAADDVRKALEATTTALNNAVRHFKVDIHRPDSPAGFAGPVR